MQSETTETVHAVADRIEQAVATLAEQLEVPASGLWESAVSYVWGVALAEVAIYATLFVAWFILAARHLPNTSDSLDDDTPVRFMGCTVLGIVGVLLAVGLLEGGPERIGHLFAPEVGVLKMLGEIF